MFLVLSSGGVTEGQPGQVGRLWPPTEDVRWCTRSEAASVTNESPLHLNAIRRARAIEQLRQSQVLGGGRTKHIFRGGAHVRPFQCVALTVTRETRAGGVGLTA